MLENSILPSRLSLKNQIFEFSAVVIVCGLISTLLYTIFIQQEHSFWTYFLTTFGYGLSIYISSLLFQLAKPHWPAWLNYVLSLVIGILLGSVLLIIGRYIQGHALESFGNVTPIFLGAAFSFIGTSLFFLRTRWAMASNMFQKERLERLEQEKLLVQAQLSTLQAQIEPHFFFNTLATIRSLIDLDQDAAKKMLSNLTDLFRLVLDRQQARQDLQLEMDIIRRYLSIQSIRLGHRLQYHIEHDPNINPLFPPLLIQPLIENAIKHGIEPKLQGGQLWINIEKNHDQLHIRIKDDGLGFQEGSSGHGLGIKNVRERLFHQFGEQGSLSVYELPQGGVCSMVQIPFSEES